MGVIENDGRTKICQAASHQYPLDVWKATGALVGNTIMICGGISQDFSTRYSSCYSFGLDLQWKILSQMSTKIYGGSSIAIHDAAATNGRANCIGFYEGT